MKTKPLSKWLVTLIVCLAMSSGLLAQELGCDQIASMARMARSRSSLALTQEKQKAGDSYRAQVVFASRLLELNPKDKRAAVLLLDLIPKGDAQQTIWMTFGDSLCSSESVTDMESLGRQGENLARNLARAVLLVPEKMPSYVSYALTSTLDPHSDYAVQMQTVCRVKHAEFIKAIEELPSDKKGSFVKHVLNPERCKPLALPEAD